MAPSVDIEADATYCDGDPIADLTVVSSGGGTINWYSDAGLTSLLFTGTVYTPTPGIGTRTQAGISRRPQQRCPTAPPPRDTFNI